MKKTFRKNLFILVLILASVFMMPLSSHATGTSVYDMDIAGFETSDGLSAPKGMLAINAESTGSDSTSAIFKSVHTDDLGYGVEIYKGESSGKGVYMTQMGMSLSSFKVLTYDITFKRDYIGDTPFYLNIRFQSGLQIPIFNFRADSSIHLMGEDSGYDYSTGTVYRIKATFDFEKDIAKILIDGGDFQNTLIDFETSTGGERPNRIDLGFNGARSGAVANAVIGNFSLYEDVSLEDSSFRITDIKSSLSYNTLSLTEPLRLTFSDAVSDGFENRISLKEKETGDTADILITTEDKKTLTLNLQSPLSENSKYVLKIDAITSEGGSEYSYEKEFSTLPLYKTDGIKVREDNTVEVKVRYNDGKQHDDYFFIKTEDETGTNVYSGEKMSQGYYVFTPEVSLEGKTITAYLLDGETFHVISHLQGSLGSASDILENEFSANLEEKKFTIKGKSDSQKPFMAMVLNPGFTKDDIKEEGCINHIALITPGADGSFDYEFDVFGSSGYYSAYILSEGEIKAFQSPIFYATKEHIDEALLKISKKDNETAASLKAELESAKEILGLDLSLYSSLSDDEKEKACLIMLNNRNKENNGIIENVSKAQDLFYEASLIYSLKICETPEQISDVLEKADDKYFEKFRMNDIYVGFDEDKAEEFSKILFESEISADSDTFIETFKKSIALCAFKKAEHWSEIKKLMKDAKEILDGVNFEKYEKKSDTSSVDKKIIKSEFSDFDDLIEKINKCINAKEESSSGGGGGGGGGSGSTVITDSHSSSSGAVTTLPSMQDEEKEDKKTFSDMGDSLWAKDAVDELSKRGIVQGRNDTCFDPTGTVTREEFVKMIALAFLKDDAGVEAKEFLDVEKTRWSYEYISKCASLGIISGTGEGKFSPDAKITREDMAKIIYGALRQKLNFNSGNMRYNDYHMISDYAKEAVKALSEAGIVKGEGQNLFSPKSYTTRAAAAQIIYNALSVLEK